MSYLTLNDIESYRISFELSNKVWDLVIAWSYLAQKTIGAQFIDASDSISANIAEGYARYSKKELVRFLLISNGSLAEVETYLEIANDLGYINSEELNKINQDKDEIRRLLGAFVRSAKK